MNLQQVAHLVFLAIVFVSPSYPPASVNPQVTAACTYEIPPEITEIDGNGDYAYVRPGDTLCLLAGERGNIKFLNLHGTAGSPITVRNHGGKVTISGSTFLSGGIGIVDSTYLRITGTGVSEQCGSQYSASEQQCGIEITNTHKGIKIDLKRSHVGNLEIDHVSVHDTSQTIHTRGITIHPPQGTLVSGLYVHHNYVARTSAEGIYLGAEPHGQPYEVLGKVSNIEISFNLVEQTGFDGIKVKVGIDHIYVHNNKVLSAGLSRTPAHQGGIKAAMSVGDFYNNYVFDSFEGIRMGRPLEDPNTRYFNNVIVNSESVCIEAKELNAQVYNNTLIRCGDFGINASGDKAKVFNNIIANPLGMPIQAYLGNIHSNIIGSISDIGFRDPAKNDYRLCSDSPAVDAVYDLSTLLAFDLDGTPRPLGPRRDLGAFEYLPGEPRCQ